ncbi:TrmH family RNA methyltransferase [Candidatus Saccharibacteria bacterium]|nr:TrmH family RNA methyltransferase [Candidatus Saccharibacteria bacterium]
MPHITLLLHNIRSTHNVGSIFRTAEGLGVEKIILSGYTPYPTFHGDSRLPHLAEKITTQIHKTALGAEKIVPFAYHEAISDWLKTNHLPIVALEQTPHSIPLRDFMAPDSFVLLLGEEVHGIEQSLLDICQNSIEIPMVGKKESFNVSVAAGIALYSLTLQ